MLFRKANISGFRFKNLTISMEAGQQQYGLSKTNALGLPENALVFGVTIRSKSQSSVSHNYRDLIPNSVKNGMQLTIKDTSGKDIISELPLLSGYAVVSIGGAGATTIYFEPRLAREIDWERSNVNIPQYLIGNITGNEDFEMYIMYTLNGNSFDQRVLPALNLRTGINVEPTRYKKLEVIELAGRANYSLSKNSTIGIDKDAVLVGISTYYYGVVGSTSGTLPTDRSGAFLTIKRFQEDLWDKVSVELNGFLTPPAIGPANQSLYIPIEPTRVGDIDWEASQLTIADDTLVVANASCLFSLAYVQKVN